MFAEFCPRAVFGQHVLVEGENSAATHPDVVWHRFAHVAWVMLVAAVPMSLPGKSYPAKAAHAGLVGVVGVVVAGGVVGVVAGVVVGVVAGVVVVAGVAAVVELVFVMKYTTTTTMTIMIMMTAAIAILVPFCSMLPLYIRLEKTKTGVRQNNSIAMSDELDKLLSVVEHVQNKSTHDTLWQALVPLAAIALKSADRIDGLEAVLKRHGWNGVDFGWPLDVAMLKCDLIQLYESNYKSTGDTVKTLPAPSRWCAAKPVASLLDKVEWWRGILRLPRIDAHMLRGRLQSEISNSAQLAIINSSKIKNNEAATERLKSALVQAGWSIDSYFFHEVPDLDLLYQTLTHEFANSLHVQ